MTRIAINGMGRIGRAAFKQIIEDETLELAAVNDLVPAEELAYLLKHDSVYGRYERDVRAQNGRLLVNDGQSCVALNERSLDKLPWRDLAVDIVLECRGMFTMEADLKRHADAGARYVILSAPIEGGDVPTIVHGVNSAARNANIVSCASCTTNCITPVIEILGGRLGILKGGARYRDIVGVSDEAIVSTDIIHDPRASIIDCTLTQVVDGDLVNVMSWYDNEWGYTAQLVREAKAMARAD